jgi:nucleoside-diphosphate-sugar epimerase
MSICVIGGTGHIGKNLVSMLLEDGADFTVLTSGRSPVPTGDGWDRVKRVECSYGSDEWAACLQDLAPSVLIDILGNDAPGTYQAVKSTCKHFILCGSVWMFGEPQSVPTPDETQTPCPFEGYNRRYEEMQALFKTAARDGIAYNAVMPPNICGPYKIPLDGHGGRSIEVHKAHQRGEPCPLPAPGNNLVGPCDAWDVAQGFFLSCKQPDKANGHIFNVGAPYALTSKKFIETYGEIYGTEIPIDWYGWKEYSEEIIPEFGANFHFGAHMCPDLTKIHKQLGYVPKYTPEQTMERAVDWMRAEGLL